VTPKYPDPQYGFEKRGFKLGIFLLHFTKNIDDWQEGEVFSIEKLFNLTVSGQPFCVLQTTRAVFHLPKCLVTIFSPLNKMEKLNSMA
jgi:hypothetical protein